MADPGNKGDFLRPMPSERWHSVLPQSTPQVRNVFTFESVLGKGSFGTTYLVKHKGTKEEYACKSIPKHKLASRHQLEAARLELDIQNKLSGHPNVVTLQGVYEDNMELHIILELCSGGTIYDVLVKTGVFSEAMASRLMHQVLTSVAYCHKSNIMHRDIKLENFLLSDPSPDAILKLADFGLSKKVSSNTLLTSCCGTPQYMAPEVLDQRYTMKADVWSCGVVLFIILGGSYPFSGTKNETIRDSIKAGLPDLTVYPWNKISKDAKHCLLQMLVSDPSKRPTAEEMLLHPFLTNSGEIEQTPLDAEIIIRLRKFAGVLRFKQAAARKLAEMLPLDKMDSLKAAYEALDTDSDGMVTVSELKMELQRRGVPPVELEDIAASLDVDGNGMIDLREFLGAALKIGQDMQKEHMMAVFKTFDTDGDGFIDQTELSQALKALQPQDEQDSKDLLVHQVRDTIKAADQNNDGRIDLAEFQELLRQQESMSLVFPATTTAAVRSPTGRLSFYDIYEFGKVIRPCMYGNVAAGCVYEVTHKERGTKYSCKTINKLGLPPQFDFRSEERILRRLTGSSCIIALVEVKEGANHLHMLTERCDGPDLFSMLSQRKKLTEVDASTAMAAVLLAVAHCHSVGVVHRDVRAETFLWKSATTSVQNGNEETPQLKAAEFSLAVEWRSSRPPLKDVVGSLYYIAPEVLAQQYGFQADVWSAGVLMHVLLAGKYPFRGSTQPDTFRLISQGELNLTGSVWQEVSEPAKDLLKKLLTKDPAQRITASEALKHPWVAPAAEAINAPGVAPVPNADTARELPSSVLEGMKAKQALKTFIMALVHSVVKRLPDSQLSAIKAEFETIDTNKSGTICLRELVAYLKKYLVEVISPLEWMSQHDVDGDNEVDLSEFCLALQQNSAAGKETQLREAFKAAGKNSHYMTRDEVQSVLESCATTAPGTVLVSPEAKEEVLKFVDGTEGGVVVVHDVIAMLRQKMWGPAALPPLVHCPPAPIG